MKYCITWNYANYFTNKFLLTSYTIVSNRQDACSTKDKFSCGTGILPVAKKLIENGAISQFLPTLLLQP
ncbi:hypothetical protein QUB70_05905 [Microcoleus sp. A003_D6]|uniref:hypothetical protein n=1 Tax=Microcoleus sp. A003_D6 TaxID=3055266 RepID=UPI002FD4D7FC